MAPTKRAARPTAFGRLAALVLENKEVLAVVLLAFVLRASYVYVTPWWVRGHDADGHLAYVQYVLDHWTIPPTHDSPQFYHPPAYYFLGALLVRVAAAFSSAPKEVVLQWYSLALSFLTVAAAAWCGFLLFPQPKQWIERFGFLSIVGTFPALIFFSSRVNNDALYAPFAFLAFALTLLWWKKPTTVVWLWLCVVIGAGLLVKTNMVLWIPISFLVLWASAKVTLKGKIASSLLLACSLLLIAGWYEIPRVVGEDNDMREVVVGNVNHQTGALENRPAYFLTFNPVQVLRYPFNEVVGEGSRRLYHWEYFYRSAFFGEFRYPAPMRVVGFAALFASLLLLPLVFVRFVAVARRLRTSVHAPLAIASVVLLAGALADRLVMPFSSSQDFRYSVALFIPWAAWMAAGIAGPFTVKSLVHQALCTILAGSMVAFMLLLVSTPA